MPKTDISSKKSLIALGLMSGTSMDGIDLALIRSDGEGLREILAFDEMPYSPDIKTQIVEGLEAAKSLKTKGRRNKTLKTLEKELTEIHVCAVNRFLDAQDLKSEQIDVIGFHGQTVLHRPDLGFTVQLGLGQLLADKTGIPVVYDMRANDMKYGGQGAPLIPIYHKVLAEALDPVELPEMPVAFVNIGGISNISYIGQDGLLIAFDTGPGNALIDQWVESQAGIPFDQSGLIASEGHVNMAVINQYLDESFFEKTIPKSLDRNDFRPLSSGRLSLEDGARTLAFVTAAAIVKSCDHLPVAPKLWVVSGGGRKNPSIMQDLKKLAHEQNGANVILSEEAGFNGDTMEAEAWAYLAIRSLKRLPLTFPTTTNCRKPVSGGRIVFPR